MPIPPALTPIIRAVAETVTPETTGLNQAGWRTLQHTIDGAVATRPPRMQRQLALFLRAIQWLPLLRYGRPFTSLSPETRRRFLSSLEDSPLLLVRRGFWGLRTLVLMGYYTQADVIGAIGYRADPRGWSRRR